LAEAYGLSRLTLGSRDPLLRQSILLAGVDVDCHCLMSQMANARWDSARRHVYLTAKTLVI